jgi:hypothetical protein
MPGNDGIWHTAQVSMLQMNIGAADFGGDGLQEDRAIFQNWLFKLAQDRGRVRFSEYYSAYRHVCSILEKFLSKAAIFFVVERCIALGAT